MPAPIVWNDLERHDGFERQDYLDRKDKILNEIISRFLENIEEKKESPKQEIPVSMDWYAGKLSETLGLIEKRSGWKFYGFQQKWLFDFSKFKSCAKSRQIGMTVTSASDAVNRGLFLGVDTLYTSSSSRQYLRAKRYAKNYLKLLQKIYPEIEIIKDNENTGELAFTSIDPEGNVRNDYASIYFIPSNDISNIEGFPGRVFIDELSNIKNANDLYTSLLPSLGSNSLYDFACQFRARGKGNLAYRIHENTDNQYPTFSRHTITIDDAIAGGFPFDKEAMFANLPEEAVLEQYYVIFLESGYSPFGEDLVKSCEASEFDLRGEEITGSTFGGWDFAHERNSSILTVFEKLKDGKKVQRDRIELTKLKNPEQERIARKTIERYGLRGLAIEYIGAGIPIVQNLEERYGSLIMPFKTTNENQTDSAENFKFDLEDKAIKLFANERQRESICAVQRLILPSGKVKYEAKNKDEHGDDFRACCLANWACDQVNHGPIEWFTSSAKRVFGSTGRLFRRGGLNGR